MFTFNNYTDTEVESLGVWIVIMLSWVGRLVRRIYRTVRGFPYSINVIDSLLQKNYWVEGVTWNWHEEPGKKQPVIVKKEEHFDRKKRDSNNQLAINYMMLIEM